MKPKILYFKLSEKYQHETSKFTDTTRTVFVKRNFIAFYPMLEKKEGLKLVNKSSILRNLKQQITPKINRRKETIKIENHQIENKNNN